MTEALKLTPLEHKIGITIAKEAKDSVGSIARILTDFKKREAMLTWFVSTQHDGSSYLELDPTSMRDGFPINAAFVKAVVGGGGHFCASPVAHFLNTVGRNWCAAKPTSKP